MKYFVVFISPWLTLSPVMDFRRGNAHNTTPLPLEAEENGGVDTVMVMVLMILTCRASLCYLHAPITATFKLSTAKPVRIILLVRLQTLLRWDAAFDLQGHVTYGLLPLVPYSLILRPSRRIVV